MIDQNPDPAFERALHVVRHLQEDLGLTVDGVTDEQWATSVLSWWAGVDCIECGRR